MRIGVLISTKSGYEIATDPSISASKIIRVVNQLIIPWRFGSLRTEKWEVS